MIDSTPTPDSPQENPGNTPQHSHEEESLPQRSPEFSISPEHRAAIEHLVEKWKEFDFSDHNISPAAEQFLEEWRSLIDFEHVGSSTGFLCSQIFLPGLDSFFQESGYDSDGTPAPPEIRIDTSVSPNVMHVNSFEPVQVSVLEYLEALGFGQGTEQEMALTELFNKAFASSMQEVVALWKAGLIAEEGDEIEYQRSSLANRIAGIEQRISEGDLSERDTHLERELLKRFSADLVEVEGKASDPLGALGLQIETTPTDILFRSTASQEEVIARSESNQLQQQNEQEAEEHALGESLLGRWRAGNFQRRIELSDEASSAEQEWIDSVTAEEVFDGVATVGMFAERILHSGPRSRRRGSQNDRSVTFSIENGSVSATLSSSDTNQSFHHDDLVQGFHNDIADNQPSTPPVHSELILAYILSSLPDSAALLDQEPSYIAVEYPDENTLVFRRKSQEEISQERRLDTTLTQNYLRLQDSETLPAALEHLAELGAVLGERGGTQQAIEAAQIVSFDYLDDVYRVIHPVESAGTVVPEQETEQYIVARRVAGERGVQLPVIIAANRRDELISTPGASSVSNAPDDVIIM